MKSCWIPARQSDARRTVLPAGLALGIALVTSVLSFPAEAAVSLNDAIAAAERSAPDLRARTAGIDAAEAAVGPAGQLPDPELIVGLQNLPVSGDDAFSASQDFMTMRTVGVMQSFPRREKRQLRTERAIRDVDREQALLTSERLGIREAATRAWIAAWSAEQRVALLMALRPRAEAQRIAALAALTAGRGSAADGIAAHSAVAALEDRIAAARADRDSAREDLTRWVPDLSDQPLSDPPDWRAFDAAPDALRTNMSRHRELLVYDAAERAAMTDVALARAEKRPDWSLEFGYAQRGPQFSDMLTLQLRVPLPLFAARRQNPLIAARERLVTRVRAERVAVERRVGAELGKALTTWRSAIERMSRYEQELLPLGEDRADAALAAYRGGRGDVSGSLRALDEVIEQRIVYTDLQRALGQSWATLRFAFATEAAP